MEAFFITIALLFLAAGRLIAVFFLGAVICRLPLSLD
jgi:hypothetical protein